MSASTLGYAPVASFATIGCSIVCTLSRPRHLGSVKFRFTAFMMLARGRLCLIADDISSLFSLVRVADKETPLRTRKFPVRPEDARQTSHLMVPGHGPGSSYCCCFKADNGDCWWLKWTYRHDLQFYLVSRRDTRTYRCLVLDNAFAFPTRSSQIDGELKRQASTPVSGAPIGFNVFVLPL